MRNKSFLEIFGLPEAPKTGRERLMATAVDLFYRRGMSAVGIDQIISAAGVTKSTFYKHFESKEDLMLAALEMQNSWLQDTFLTMIRDRGGPTAIGQLYAVFDVVEHIIESDEYQGCIFINVAMEFPLVHEPAHLAAAEHKRAIEALVRELAVEAHASDPAALAKELCLVMEGAYVTRQVTGDKETIAIARRVAERVIAAHLPRD